MKLPNIEIPKFDEDFKKLPTFRVNRPAPEGPFLTLHAIIKYITYNMLVIAESFHTTFS